MQRLADIMLEYWDAPWFSAFRGFLMGALVVCVIWVVCELRKRRIDPDEEEEHEQEYEQEQEAKPYGGFVRWDMETAPQQVAYAAVAERLIEFGVLKVQIENTPTGTVCYWGIKAVEEVDDEHL